jgi:hypothetical protein
VAFFKIDGDLVVSRRQGSTVMEVWRLMDMEAVNIGMKS